MNCAEVSVETAVAAYAAVLTDSGDEGEDMAGTHEIREVQVVLAETLAALIDELRSIVATDLRLLTEVEGLLRDKNLGAEHNVARDEILVRVRKTQEEVALAGKAITGINIDNFIASATDEQSLPLDPNIRKLFAEADTHALAIKGDAQRLLQAAANSSLERGHLHCNANQYKLALKDYTRAIQLRADMAAAYRYRGRAYFELEMFEKAILDYTRELDLEPNSKEAFYDRGNSYLQLGNYAAAVDDCKEAVRLDPLNGVAHDNLGSAYYHQKQYSEAVLWHSKALDLDPDDALSYFHRAKTHIAMGEEDCAIADLTRCLVLEPDDSEALLMRGNLHYKSEQYDLALCDYQDAVATDPSVEGQYRTRMAFLKKKQQRVARRTKGSQVQKGKENAVPTAEEEARANHQAQLLINEEQAQAQKKKKKKKNKNKNKSKSTPPKENGKGGGREAGGAGAPTNATVAPAVPSPQHATAGRPIYAVGKGACYNVSAQDPPLEWEQVQTRASRRKQAKQSKRGEERRQAKLAKQHALVEHGSCLEAGSVKAAQLSEHLVPGQLQSTRRKGQSPGYAASDKKRSSRQEVESRTAPWAPTVPVGSTSAEASAAGNGNVDLASVITASRTGLENFAALPTEVVVRVLKHLSHVELCTLRQSCWSLYRMAANRSLWKCFDCKGVSVERYLVTDRLMSKLMRCGPMVHVEALVLSGCMRLTSAALRDVCAVCPELTRLDLSFCNICDDALGFLRSPSRGRLALTALSLRGCKGVSDAGMVALLRLCPRLEVLDLAWCTAGTDGTLRAIARHCPALVALHLDGWGNVSEVALQTVITECALLHTLGLMGCRALSGQLLQHLLFTPHREPRLGTLSLRSCAQLTDNDVCFFVSFFSQSLRVLDLSRCHGISDQTLAVIATVCEGLTTLDIRECQGVTSAGISALARLPHLTRIRADPKSKRAISKVPLWSQPLPPALQQFLRIRIDAAAHAVHVPPPGAPNISPNLAPRLPPHHPARSPPPHLPHVPLPLPLPHGPPVRLQNGAHVHYHPPPPPLRVVMGPGAMRRNSPYQIPYMPQHGPEGGPHR